MRDNLRNHFGVLDGDGEVLLLDGLAILTCPDYVFRTISVQCSGDTRSLLSGKDRLLATKLILFS